MISQSYEHSSRLLRLDSADPIQLQQHAFILINDSIPLLQALANETQTPLPVDWIKQSAKELGKIVTELLAAVQSPSAWYVIELISAGDHLIISVNQ